MDNEPDKKESSISDQLEEIKQENLEGYWVAVRKARNALFWTAGLVFAGEMITMARTHNEFEPIVFIIALVEAGIFIALAMWTKHKPYTAIITGLIVFILLTVLVPIILSISEGGDGESIAKAIFGGIIIKIIILVNLGKALNDARELQKAKGHGV